MEITPSEADVKIGCQHLLKILANRGKLLYQRNNSFAGVVMRKNGSSGYINNNMPGSPDFYVFTKSGTTLHIELKAPKGKQRPEQKTWEANCKKLGHRYYIVRSIEELQKILVIYL